MHRTVAKRGFERDIGGGWEAWKACVAALPVVAPSLLFFAWELIAARVIGHHTDLLDLIPGQY